MGERYTCTDCGSRTINKTVDESSAGSPGRDLVQVPVRCSNSSCPNSIAGEQSLNWARRSAE